MPREKTEKPPKTRRKNSPVRCQTRVVRDGVDFDFRPAKNGIGRRKKPPVNGRVPRARSPPITYNGRKIDLHVTEFGRKYVCGSRNLLPGRYNKKTTPPYRRRPLGYWPCPSRQIIAKKVIISTSPPLLSRRNSVDPARSTVLISIPPDRTRSVTTTCERFK